jgi:hypothetical protein
LGRPWWLTDRRRRIAAGPQGGGEPSPPSGGGVAVVKVKSGDVRGGALCSVPTQPSSCASLSHLLSHRRGKDQRAEFQPTFCRCALIGAQNLPRKKNAEGNHASVRVWVYSQVGYDWAGFLSNRYTYIPPSKGEVSLNCSLNIGCSVYPLEKVYTPTPLSMGPFIPYVGIYPNPARRWRR